GWWGACLVERSWARPPPLWVLVSSPGGGGPQPRAVLRLSPPYLAKPLPGKPRKLHAAGKLPLHPLELLHHLAQLRVLLQEPVHVLHVGPAAARDPLPPPAVHHLPPLPLPFPHHP